MNQTLSKSQKERWEQRRKTRKRRKFRKLLYEFFWFSLFSLLFVIAVWQYKKTYNASDNKETQAETQQYAEAAVNSDYLQYAQEVKGIVKDTDQLNAILSRIDEYPTDILDLLVNNPETLDFVLGYFSHKDDNSAIVLSTPRKGEIPYYQQWDLRWGYRTYGDNIIAVNGCGPTCLSMVAVGLLDDTSLDPKYIADYSYEHGYYDETNGTYWKLMDEGAKDLGLTSQELGLDKQVIINNLKKGRPIIASMKPGDFTKTGHYIVLVSIDENNKVTVYDPNSINNTNKIWNLEIVISQIKNLWAFSASS
jgi:hypothetical protein